MKYSNKQAFSMIEVVLVILILGIVSSIGSEIIADVYKGYILERATYRSGVKTELAASQIANRLAYAIPRTVIGRSANGNFRPISVLGGNANQFTILEWIGYDNDSFSAQRVPGWSGFIDLDVSTPDNLVSNGSNLNTTDTIITNLSNNRVGIVGAGLFVAGAYNVNNIGYGNNNGGVVTVNAINNNNNTFDVNVSGRTLREFYKLAWSAYALEPIADNDGTFDLVLHYNYRPWNGETFNNGEDSIIARNVTVFRFIGSGDTIRFKLCQRERISGGRSITMCKEKAVIR